MRDVLILLVLLICALGCSDDNGKGKPAAGEGEKIFYTYEVNADEGREEVTVRLQFYEGGEDGDAVLLESPGGVQLDGMTLQPDSTKFTGTYYEVSKPVNEFTGKHTIVFIDPRKKKQQTDFTFSPFYLAEEIQEEMPKKPFAVRLRGLPDEPTTLRLVMTDTSMTSKGVNEEILVQKNELEVTEEHLVRLTKGPVTLELYHEEERPLRNNDKLRGRLTINYGLKRQFVLQ